MNEYLQKLKAACKHATPLRTQNPEKSAFRRTMSALPARGRTPFVEKHHNSLLDNDLMHTYRMINEQDFDADRNKVIAVHTNIPSNMIRTTWSLSHFKFIRLIHISEYVKVCLCKCRLSHRIVVLKMYKRSVGEYRLNQIYREIVIHMKLFHTNVVQMFAAFKEKPYIILVQQFNSGVNLSVFMKSEKIIRMREDAAKPLVSQLIEGLAYLHGHNICHRDIKKENILLNSKGLLQICDFGVSIDLNSENAVTRCGTSYYIAPEVQKCPLKRSPEDNKHRTDLFYNCKSDIWSVGILAYELMVGTAPLDMGAAPPVFPKTMSIDAIYFICKCLCRNASRRASAKQLLECHWLKK